MKSLRLVPASLLVLALVAGCGDSSAPTAATPSLDSTPPAAPSEVWSSGSGDAIRIEWEASSAPDIAGYQLFVYAPSPDRDNSYVQVAELPAGTTYYDLPPVNAEFTQWFRIRAIDDSGNRSAMSAMLEIDRGPDDPPSPQPDAPGRSRED